MNAECELIIMKCSTVARDICERASWLVGHGMPCDGVSTRQCDEVKLELG
jgi:hypothetical protein